MQNRYVGDIGDYGKYALLRHLCGHPPDRLMRLAVVWCLFPDETATNDGRHVSYLKDAGFAALEPDLYEILRSIVWENRRQIASVAESGYLPARTVFFDNPVIENFRAAPRERLRHRDSWIQDCLRQTSDCDLVFLDPDNGLEVKSIAKHQIRAGKYVYWDELTRFWERGDALLVYHHLNRTAPSALQVRLLTRRFSGILAKSVILPLVFRRGSSRVFWLIHRGDSRGLELQRRAANLLSTGWSRHFRPFGWPDGDQPTTPSG
jgi:hypothetical protein